MDEFSVCLLIVIFFFELFGINQLVDIVIMDVNGI